MDSKVVTICPALAKLLLQQRMAHSEHDRAFFQRQIDAHVKQHGCDYISHDSAKTQPAQAGLFDREAT